MHAELLIAPDLQGGLKHVGRAGKAERHALVLVRNEAPRYTCWGFETVSDMIDSKNLPSGIAHEASVSDPEQEQNHLSS